jgi:putative ABC transport system ATP-binding protein
VNRESAPLAPQVIAPAVPIVRARGLSRRFGAGSTVVHALRDVDLDVRAGESLAIVGPSGSGKSTLLHVIGGIEDADAGTLEVAGVTLAAMTDEDRARYRRRTIGFVFQSFNLIPTMTALENVMFPGVLDARAPGPLRERARTLLAEVGLAGREASSPDRLSGGEQQRVALARALVNEPPLVLADEPTGNLDSASGAHVLSLLVRLVAERGTTLLMVTHSEAARARLARTIHMQDGRVHDGAITTTT